MKIEEKLIYLRKQNGMSQLQLSERLEVSRQAVSRWEVGAAIPSTDNLKVLSDLYGVPVDVLLNDDMGLSNKGAVAIEKEEIPNKKVTKQGVTMLCILVAIVTFLICIVLVRERINSDIIPIEELETEVNSTPPSGSFEIGW